MFTSFGKCDPMPSPPLKMGSMPFGHSDNQWIYAAPSDVGSPGPDRPANIQRDQRRTPYYYNDLLTVPTVDLKSHDEDVQEVVADEFNVDDHTHTQLELLEIYQNDSQIANDELQRNTLFNASMIGSSSGSLEDVI